MNDSRMQWKFGPLLRSYRRRARLTQRHLADLSTVSVRAIRNLEQGTVRSPRLETVRLLTDALRLGTAERDALLDAAKHGPHAGVADGAHDRASSTPWCVPGLLVGRDTEVASLTELLKPSESQLVGVVGISGVGKSHLAAEAVRCVAADDVTVPWVPPGGQVPAEDLAPGSSHQPLLLVLDDADLSNASVVRLGSLKRWNANLRALLTVLGASTCTCLEGIDANTESSRVERTGCAAPSSGDVNSVAVGLLVCRPSTELVRRW